MNMLVTLYLKRFIACNLMALFGNLLVITLSVARDIGAVLYLLFRGQWGRLAGYVPSADVAVYDPRLNLGAYLSAQLLSEKAGHDIWRINEVFHPNFHNRFSIRPSHLELTYKLRNIRTGKDFFAVYLAETQTSPEWMMSFLGAGFYTLLMNDNIMEFYLDLRDGLSSKFKPTPH